MEECRSSPPPVRTQVVLIVVRVLTGTVERRHRSKAVCLELVQNGIQESLYKIFACELRYTMIFYFLEPIIGIM